MSTPDPKKPAAAKPETLEDLVYQPSISAGHRELARGNPLVTWPLTFLLYGTFGYTTWYFAQNTETGKIGRAHV